MAILESVIDPNLSLSDIAYQILKDRGEPIYFRELITQVLALKPISGRDLGHQIAAVHTELNMDNRFVHQSGGMWALRELVSPRIIRQYEEDWDT